MESTKYSAEANRLYVVATPIGNLGDITLRATQILASVDYIVAEDTRLAHRLMQHLGLPTQVSPIHLREERRAAHKIIDLLANGKKVALICDAGTPGISDPGGKAVQIVRESGFKIVPIPGASAITTAYAAAGLAETPFLFYGFLPNSSNAQSQLWESLLPLPYALVFFEAPHRVYATIQHLQTYCSDREIFFARELTKFHEDLHRCPIAQALTWLEENSYRQQGEFVIILTPPIATAVDPILNEADRAVFRALLTELPLAKAAKLAAQITKKDRTAFYSLGHSPSKNN